MVFQAGKNTPKKFFHLLNNFFFPPLIHFLSFHIFSTAPCFPFFFLFSLSFSSAMALKFSHVLFIILWLSLLLLFREFYNFKYSKIINTTTNQSNTITTTSHFSSHHPLISRKVLASNFDFTPFLNHHHDHHHQQQKEKHHNRKASPDKQQQEPAASDEDQSEIDPRYGVEKRRVPTGPNPLHHWWKERKEARKMVSGELDFIILYDVFFFFSPLEKKTMTIAYYCCMILWACTCTYYKMTLL